MMKYSSYENDGCKHKKNNNPVKMFGKKGPDIHLKSNQQLWSKCYSSNRY